MQPTPAMPARCVAATLLVITLTSCGAGSLTSPGTSAPEPVEQVDDEPVDLPSYDPDTSVASYADGFPVDLLAAPDQAVVLASSAGLDGDMVEVSLQLSTSSTTDDLVEWYAERLAGFGFSEATDLDGGGLATQTVFTRPARDGEVADAVIIGILDDTDRRLVTISGTVAPEED